MQEKRRKGHKMPNIQSNEKRMKIIFTKPKGLQPHED